jgi:hypothetical protein
VIEATEAFQGINQGGLAAFHKSLPAPAKVVQTASEELFFSPIPHELGVGALRGDGNLWRSCRTVTTYGEVKNGG